MNYLITVTFVFGCWNCSRERKLHQSVFVVKVRGGWGCMHGGILKLLHKYRKKASSARVEEDWISTTVRAAGVSAR
jgi:hypothetical protein